MLHLPFSHPVIVLLQAVNLWALFAVLGLFITRAGVLPATMFAPGEFRTRWDQGMAAALGLLFLTSLCMPLTGAMEMSGDSWRDALLLTPAVIVHTHFGHVWLLRALMLLCLAGSWWLSRRHPAMAFLLALPSLACLVLCYSATSHAADQGDFTLAEWLDALHLVAGAAWAGCVIVFACLVFPLAGRHKQRRIVLPRGALARLSALCGMALAVLVATGTYAIWVRHTEHAHLFSTFYGHLLVTKLSLVAVMVLLGAVNRYLFVPRAEAAAGGQAGRMEAYLRGMQKTFGVEALLALGVLLIVAILLYGMPEMAMGMT